LNGAELERAFWVCDHAATQVMLDFEPALRCSHVTEDLRRLRFGGDFAAMLAWWREHKAARHAALQAADAARAAQGAAAAGEPMPAAAAGAARALRMLPRQSAVASQPAATPTARRAPAAPAASSPQAEARGPAPLHDATPEQLKAAYLHCDRLASTERFDGSAAAACSMVYEALKARVFGGDFERLLAWSRRQSQVDRAAGAASATR
jgi:hypothetical protein